MDSVSALGERSQSFGEVKSDRQGTRPLGATYQPRVSLVDAGGGIVDAWKVIATRELWGAKLAKLS
jgi:hypothetical protein